jgi:hypothetical protein
VLVHPIIGVVILILYWFGKYDYTLSDVKCKTDGYFSIYQHLSSSVKNLIRIKIDHTNNVTV